MTYKDWITFSFGLDPAAPNLFNSDYPGPSHEARSYCLQFFHAPIYVLAHMPRQLAVRGLKGISSIDGYMGLLSNPELDPPSRVELAQSHVILFEKAFFKDDFEGACFMWWEYLIGAAWRDGPPVSADMSICDQLIYAIEHILKFDSAICRRSGLHGLNEVGPSATPGMAERVLKDWVNNSGVSDPALVQYAREVLRGDAQ